MRSRAHVLTTKLQAVALMGGELQQPLGDLLKHVVLSTPPKFLTP